MNNLKCDICGNKSSSTLEQKIRSIASDAIEKGETTINIENGIFLMTKESLKKRAILEWVYAVARVELNVNELCKDCYIGLHGHLIKDGESIIKNMTDEDKPLKIIEIALTTFMQNKVSKKIETNNKGG